MTKKNNVKEFKKKEDAEHQEKKKNVRKLYETKAPKKDELKEEMINRVAKDEEPSEDPRDKMTPEEIEEYMRQEEEGLYGKLDKFLALNPKPDTSSLEEDEEEETFTLDLENNVVTQKVGEGVLTKDENGNVVEVKDPKIIEMVEEKVKEVAQPAKPDLEVKYGDMVTDRFVSKAIGSMIKRMVQAQEDIEKSIRGVGLSYVGDMVEDEAFEVVQKRKLELRSAIAGGRVHYDKIPDWAKSYIDDHVQNALNTLIDLAERD